MTCPESDEEPNAYDISLGITKAISGEDDKWGWFIE